MDERRSTSVTRTLETQGRDIRVSSATHDRLVSLARERSQTIAELIDDLVKAHDQDRFFSELEQEFHWLRADPVAWTEFQAELAEWDVTLADGLEPYDLESEH